MAIQSLETRSASCLNGSLNPQHCAGANAPAQGPPEGIRIGVQSSVVNIVFTILRETPNTGQRESVKTLNT
mgnify:CR=1 FL=1